MKDIYLLMTWNISRWKMKNERFQLRSFWHYYVFHFHQLIQLSHVLPASSGCFSQVKLSIFYFVYRFVQISLKKQLIWACTRWSINRKLALHNVAHPRLTCRCSLSSLEPPWWETKKTQGRYRYLFWCSHYCAVYEYNIRKKKQ